MSGRPRTFEQRLSSVLDLIHDVPYANGEWEPALTAIADFAGAQAADLSFFDPKTRQIARWRQARIDVDWDIGIPAEHSRMPFLVELTHPLGIADFVLDRARMRDDGSPWIMLTLNFGNGPAQRDVRSRMQMLMPHIRRACAAEEQLRAARRERDTLAEALDRIEGAVAMLNRSGQVVYANQASQQVFRRAAGVKLSADRRMVLNTNEARANLARALDSCIDPLSWKSGTEPVPPNQFTIPRPAARPLVLKLQALPPDQAGGYGAVALLYIIDPDARPGDYGAALRTVYGLTEAEAHLVHGLLGGETLKEIATRRGVTYETVRSQLRHVFDKTGVRRQADLVRLVGQLKK